MNAAFQIGYGGGISTIRRKNVWWTTKDGNWTDPTVWIGNGEKRSRFEFYPPGGPGSVTSGPVYTPVGYDSISYVNVYSNLINFPDGITGLRYGHPIGCPQPGDTVYINHSINFNPLNGGYIISSVLQDVFISPHGSLSMVPVGNSNLLFIKGTLYCEGTLSMGGSSNLFLLGAKNYITNFVKVDNTPNIAYVAFNDQDILDIPHPNLIIQGNGRKRATGNLVVGGNFSALRLEAFGSGFGQLYGWGARLSLGDYDFTVNGTTLFNTQTGWEKTGPGNVLFIGLLTMVASGVPGAEMNLSGNPNVECRGGMSIGGVQNIYWGTDRWRSGTGTWRFTTNNQTVNHTGYGGSYDCFFEIASGITVTTTGGARWQINNDIEGVDGTSILDNRGYIGYAGVEAMQTGQLICNIASNTFEYNGGNQNVKDITYWNLRVAGRPEAPSSSDGIKTAINNIVCLGTLFVTSTQTTNTFELGSYNLTVTGRTDIESGLLTKTGSGNILFGGVLFLNGQGTVTRNLGLDFLTGNPTVELRGGIRTGNFIGLYPTTRFRTGTSIWSFTTNSQSIRRENSTSSLVFECPVQIASGITLTSDSGTSWITNFANTTFIIFKNTVNGLDPTSTLRQETNSTSFFVNAGFPMGTGTFDYSAANNLVGYVSSTPLTITGNYIGLAIGGTATHTLGSNSTIQDLYIGFSYSDPSTLVNDDFDGILECSTYDLTVTGKTFLNYNSIFGGTGALSKNASGNLLFGGLVDIRGIRAGLVLTGNPNVEFRGGIEHDNNQSGISLYNTGTGTWSFTTNNQEVTHRFSTLERTWNCNVVIDGIELTFNTDATKVQTMNGSINGTNALSILKTLGLRLNHNDSNAPMITGKLYTNQDTLNTFAYTRAGNQDIKVPDDPINPGYRNLTLAGSGAKRLLGNVSVKGTYTLTSPATIDLNGFTLTNP